MEVNYLGSYISPPYDYILTSIGRLIRTRRITVPTVNDTATFTAQQDLVPIVLRAVSSSLLHHSVCQKWGDLPVGVIRKTY